MYSAFCDEKCGGVLLKRSEHGLNAKIATSKKKYGVEWVASSFRSFSGEKI